MPALRTFIRCVLSLIDDFRCRLALPSQPLQATALPRAVASFVLNIELPARRRTFIINAAGNIAANFSNQSHATQSFVIGAGHAHHVGGQRQRHCQRHARPPRKSAASHFGWMKIDAKTGAAGAAGLANIHRRSTRQRQSGCPEARYFFSKGVIGSSVSYDSASTFWPLNCVNAKAISSM